MKESQSANNAHRTKIEALTDEKEQAVSRYKLSEKNLKELNNTNKVIPSPRFYKFLVLHFNQNLIANMYFKSSNNFHMHILHVWYPWILHGALIRCTFLLLV